MKRKTKLAMIAIVTSFAACVSLSTLTHDFADRSHVAHQFDDGKSSIYVDCEKAALNGTQIAKRDAIAGLITKTRAQQLREDVYKKCDVIGVQHGDMADRFVHDAGIVDLKMDAK